MNYKHINTLCILCFTAFMSFSQDKTIIENSKVNTQKQEPHNYGGWYCPDNLNGFPAVDIRDWESVPVVNGRMATKEDAQNGAALILVDDKKYPDAKPLDIEMPKLARFYNRSSGKNEIIIVIQALHISNDSIVGFRYLNGGNGSARLDKVKFISSMEIDDMSYSKFVTLDIKINATQNEIWEVLTKPAYSEALQAIFDKENKLEADWNKSSKVNFNYTNAGNLTSAFAGDVWGSQYIQIDCESGKDQYVEKFLLLENKQTKSTEFKIVCGPYGDDFENQKVILTKWAQKVKELSEEK